MIPRPWAGGNAEAPAQAPGEHAAASTALGPVASAVNATSGEEGNRPQAEALGQRERVATSDNNDDDGAATEVKARRLVSVRSPSHSPGGVEKKAPKVITRSGRAVKPKLFD